MEILAIFLLLLGIVLLTIEVFVPGFGITGGLGIAAIIAGVVMTAHTFMQGVLMFLVIAVILTIAFSILIRFMMKRQMHSSLILYDYLKKDQKEYGDMEYFLGKEGRTITPLRPSGNVDFNGVRLDVLSSGSFVPAGTKVIVVDVDENKIIVEAVKEDSNQSNDPRSN